MIATVFALSFPFTALAWWDEGHMQVAAVAYERLSPETREKADALIRLNPEYENWVAGVPERLRSQYAFVRAAVWADDIKSQIVGYTDEGDTTNSPTAGRNIGYVDSFKHTYWHFKDIPYFVEGMTEAETDPVNLETQIVTLTKGLSTSSGLPDSVRSYDLVWLLHLVGDAHQPLHATALFSKALKKGDQGGNFIEVTPANGQTVKLHAYWDGIFGGYSTPYGAIKDGLLDKTIKLPEPDPARAAISDPAVWLQEGRQKAIDSVYVSPVGFDKGPYELDRSYETNARKVAREQAAVAAARLANLITEALK
ncbi:S1/P1 nuclease [Rhizobium ruizarguesonis]